ncbi:MAG: flagellar export chaperone FliS [Defluviitaleaceae bacterium]|nr:flagellar export chaperone FliS [Defluviitaleaceae bacterium]MCL2239907.1 flagellar export chaperone FliS [Defluviitaleaceae bacterium]
MIRPNPYAKMQNDAIMTASKEELTLMLYEGGIKFCNLALVAMEKKDVQKCNEHIQRVQDIVREFQITLNFAYPIAHELNNLYDYMHRRLVTANIRKDLTILKEVLGMFRSMRDTWKDAMKLARAGH